MAKKRENTRKRYDDGRYFFLVGMWKESLTVKSPNSFHLFHGKTRQIYDETLKIKKGKIRNAALSDRPSLELNFVLVASARHHGSRDVPAGVETARKRQAKSSLLDINTSQNNTY